MRMLHIDVKWWRLPIINEIRRLWFHDTNLVIGSNYTYNTGKLRSFRRLTGGKGVFQKVKGGTVVSLPVMTSDWLFCLGIFLVRCGLIGRPVFVFFCFPPSRVAFVWLLYKSLLLLLQLYLTSLLCLSMFPASVFAFFVICSFRFCDFLFQVPNLLFIFSGQNCPRFLFQLYTKQNPNQTMHSPNRLNPSPSNVDLCIQML